MPERPSSERATQETQRNISPGSKKFGSEQLRRMEHTDYQARTPASTYYTYVRARPVPRWRAGTAVPGIMI